MNEQELKDYVEDKYGEEINNFKTRYAELVEISKQKYKSRDVVYFIENYFKTGKKQIKSRQYRNAKKRNTPFFSSRELASEYYELIYPNLFKTVSEIADDVLLKQLDDSISSFVEIKNIGFGESKLFDIKASDLFQDFKSKWLK